MSQEPTATPAPKRSVWYRLYRGETAYDFVGRRNIGFILSAVVLAISLISLGTRQLNLGIDFEGGVAWEYPSGDTSTDDARAVMEDVGLGAEATIQTLRGSSGERIRIQVGPQEPALQQDVQRRLAELATGGDIAEVSVNAVGPSWGDEITEKAVRALVIFFIAMALYISLRFEWKMALSGLSTVVHDVVVSVGVYSVFGFEVTPETVIAFLTILGFSLYDTIVVFDKVHENTKRLLPGGRHTYSDVVNVSMNQVLMRSLNTNIAAVLPVLALLVVGNYIMGVVALQDFSLALLVGLITGSYSSIFIATPILAMLKEREPRYRVLRERVTAMAERTSRRPAPATAGAAAAVGASPAPTAADGGAARTKTPRPATKTSPVLRAPGTTHPPRPRKKRR